MIFPLCITCIASFYNDDGYSLLDYNGEKISYGLHVSMPSYLVTGYLFISILTYY